MAIVVTHSLVTPVPESAGSGQGTGIVGPTEWNAPHMVGGFPDTPVTATVTTSSYTFTGTDANGYIPFSSASAQTALIPENVFVVGTQLTVEQAGVGVLSVTNATTNVIIHPAPPITVVQQYGIAAFFQKATNVWTAAGAF